MTGKREKIEIFIDKAGRDLRAAEVLLRDEDAEYHSGNICFHCQQCVEKLLKAFLTLNDSHTPKTHDLLFLLELCSDYDAHFKSFDLSDFVSFSVEIRYDDPAPNISEARNAIATTTAVADYVRLKLRDESEA